MAVVGNEDDDLQFILSLDDTDVEKEDHVSHPIQQSSDSFNVSELIVVLERISSSTVKSEADLATTMLSELDNTIAACFITTFVRVFRHLNDQVEHIKSESIRAIKVEKEFTKLRNNADSELYMTWKQLAGNSAQSDCHVVYQHVIQHFWSCVALKIKSGDVQPCNPSLNIIDEGSCAEETDEAERMAIRRHAGWAIKRARDTIHSGAKMISIKKARGDTTTTTEVTKKCLLGFFEKFGGHQRQDSGQFLFIVNDLVVDFFVFLHKEVENFVKSGIYKDTVVECLKYLSVSQDLRSEWNKVVGVLSGEEEAAGIIILQRVVTMFIKSKQQIIREQLHLKPQKQSISLRQSLSITKK